MTCTSRVARFVLPLLAATLLAPVASVSAYAAVSSRQASAPPSSGIGIALQDAALSRRNDPRAHIYIDDFVAPGTVLVRHVRVSNFDPTPAHILLYADASDVGSGGWQVADGHVANELTSWITIAPATLDLPPGKSAVATVTITVPRTASAVERYATILAELPAQPKAGQQVAIATRVGVRVYLSVGSGGEPPSDFTISTLTAQRDSDGTPEVTAQVTNTGQRALDVGGSLSLSNGPGGLRAGPYSVSVPSTIGIGKTGNVLVRLDRQTPAGPWLAQMTLRSGYVERAASATITFPAAAGTVGRPVKATAVPLTRNRNVLVPVALGLIGLLVIGLALLWWRRRRRDDDDQGTSSSGRTPRIPTPRAPARSRSRVG